MIFQKDEKGLLHQVEVTLEQLAAEGKQVNLLISQHMYVIFTEIEQEKYDTQLKESREKELEEKKLANVAKEAKLLAQLQYIEKDNKLK